MNITVVQDAQVVKVVGAACSRDHLISRLQAAPTVCFETTRAFILQLSDFALNRQIMGNLILLIANGGDFPVHHEF